MPIDQASTEQEALIKETGTAGSLLAEARKARGLDEKQVADHLHITVHYVKAIEADCYEKLPGAIFAKGYIKSYANYLSLDVDDILSRYQTVAGQQQSAPTRIKAPVGSKPRRQRNLQWALASVAVFSAVLIAAWLLNGESGTDNDVALASTAASSSESNQRDLSSTEESSRLEAPLSQEVALAATLADSPAVEDLTTGLSQLAAESTADQTSDSASQDSVQADSAMVANSPAIAEASPATDSSQDIAASTGADSVAATSPESSEAVADRELTTASTDSIASSDTIAAAAGGDTGQLEASTDLPAVAQEPATTVSTASRTEELAVINVMQGGNGERIIAVDANGEDVLRISFSGESWVEVNDSQARIVYRDLRQAGDVLEITGHAPFNILLGDAPLASLRFNGDEIDVSDDIRIDNSARLTVGL